MELSHLGPIGRAPKEWQRAFVTCFTGTPHDERENTNAVVGHTGMEMHYEQVTDHEAFLNIEKAIFSHETIYWFPTVGPWMLYRAMRSSGVRISLDGEGSDGILGSHPEYIKAELKEAVARLDWRRYLELRSVLRGLTGGNFHIDAATIIGELRWFAKYGLERLRLLDPTRKAIRSLRRRLLSRSGLAPNLISSYGSIPHRLSVLDDPRTVGMSSLEASLFNNFHRGSLPMQLTSFDRASMANGIESRMPFLDWRLVTFGFAIPNESRNGGGYTKRLLREAMKGIIPDSARLRTRKMGYISPIDYWARGALKPWLLDLCASRSFEESAVWNGRLARAQVEKAAAGQTSVSSVWPVLNAYVLEQSFKLRAQEIKQSIGTDQKIKNVVAG